MKDGQRPLSETPSSGASRGDQFAPPIVDGETQSVQDAIERAASLYFDRPGRVVELRALHVRTARGACTASGYFDNAHDFVEAAMKYDGRASGVYATLNIVAPELLARAHNRVEEYAKSATADSNVLRRVRFLIDVDPVRASGVSSTDAQLDEARQVARAIVDYLSSLGFPQPALGISGNGAHIIYGIDLPTDAGDLLQRCLQALAFRFNTATVTVDESVHKAAQLAKVYGTLACKGDALPDRPHRRSSLKLPEAGLSTVGAELLDQLAATLPRVDAPPRASGATEPRFDVEQFLTRAGVEIAKSGPWRGGARWSLAVCPFNPQHTDGAAYVVQFADGALAAGCHHNSCAGKDWRELRERLDPSQAGGRSGPSVSSVSAAPGHAAENWPAPTPLPDALAAVQPFDDDLLPPSLRPWVADIAARIQCPPDFPAVAAMTALGGVVGRRVGIRPRRYDDWLVVPNLWGAVIGRPGILKSPAIEEPLKALKRLETAAKRRFDQEQGEFEAHALVAKAQRKAAEKRIKDAVEDDSDALAIAKQAVASDVRRPVRRRYLVNDSSVEKLGELLNENPNGVTCYRDELVGLLTSLDKEGQEGARSFYLEAWNGTGRYTYDRIGRGTIDIEAAIVSIIGGIQPGPLGAYLQHAVQATKQDDGLIQRFQLAVWPDVSKQWVNVDRWPDTEARGVAYEIFEQLDQLNPGRYGAQVDHNDPDGVPFLRFDDEAQSQFDEWREGLEHRVRSGAEPAAIESHLAKYRSLVPSLALLCHLADLRDGPVGLDCVTRAIRWCEYLESHARRIYSVAVNPDLFAARALASKIQQGEVVNGFALREVYRHCWSHLSSREAVERAVNFLVDHDWLRGVREPTGGAPTIRYFISPRLVEILPRQPAKTARTSQSVASGSSVSPCGEGSAISERALAEAEEIL